MKDDFCNFGKEREMLHYLILHVNDPSNPIGLLYGQTGISLVLFHYARIRKLPAIKRVGEYLIDTVIDKILETTSIDLGNGIAGIGWAIEYLVQYRYINSSVDSLLEYIDHKIMSYDVRKMEDSSLETGLAGLVEYMNIHLQGAKMLGRKAFDSDYLEEWNHMMKYEKYNFQFSSDNYLNLSNQKMEVNTNHYTPELSPFIQLEFSRTKLGLRNGIAGFLERLLIS